MGRPDSTSTVLGVPVSWMALDFDQFFLPVQRPQTGGLLHQDLTPELDSVDSLIYGNHGELPTMAMAQVGLDSDFSMDFGKFFTDVGQLDALDSGLLPVKEEVVPTTGLMSDGFWAHEDPFSDGLEKYLNHVPEVEEEMTDITGKKRERRTSLEQRLERRNGKEQNRGRNLHIENESLALQRESRRLNQIKSSHLAHGQYLAQGLEMTGYEGHMSVADLPTEMRMDAADNTNDSLLPYSVHRSVTPSMHHSPVK